MADQNEEKPLESSGNNSNSTLNHGDFTMMGFFLFSKVYAGGGCSPIPHSAQNGCICMYTNQMTRCQKLCEMSSCSRELGDLHSEV